MYWKLDKGIIEMQPIHQVYDGMDYIVEWRISLCRTLNDKWALGMLCATKRNEF